MHDQYVLHPSIILLYLRFLPPSGLVWGLSECQAHLILRGLRLPLSSPPVVLHGYPAQTTCQSTSNDKAWCVRRFDSNLTVFLWLSPNDNPFQLSLLRHPALPFPTALHLSFRHDDFPVTSSLSGCQCFANLKQKMWPESHRSIMSRVAMKPALLHCNGGEMSWNTLFEQ